MTRRCACYLGTFDPVTRGHLDLIARGAAAFDRLVVGIGRNASKQPLLPVARRLELLEDETRDLPNVTVATFDGLAVRFCRSVGARWLLRGIRDVADFDAEVHMARVNHDLDAGIETVFLAPRAEFAHVSSRLIREILLADGPIDRFVTPRVSVALRQHRDGGTADAVTREIPLPEPRMNQRDGIISTPAAPAAIGPYSQAVRAGDLLFVSGQIALDPATGQIVAGDVAVETRQVLRNVAAICEAAGTSLAAAVKCTVYLRDMADFGAMNAVYAEFFPPPCPARATVAVAGLPKGVQVEIDAIVRLPA